MKISQLLTIIDKSDEIIISDYNASISEMFLFVGCAGDIENDNPLNEMNVVNITAHLCELLILVERVNNEA